MWIREGILYLSQSKWIICTGRNRTNLLNEEEPELPERKNFMNRKVLKFLQLTLNHVAVSIEEYLDFKQWIGENCIWLFWTLFRFTERSLLLNTLRKSKLPIKILMSEMRNCLLYLSVLVCRIWITVFSFHNSHFLLPKTSDQRNIHRYDVLNNSLGNFS